MLTEKKELKDVPLDDLIPYARNPRKNDDAVLKIKESLREFGFVKNSVTVDENMQLITGHTTVKAMKSLGWSVCPEVTQVFGLTESEKKAYRIADNRLGEIASWDIDLLRMEFYDLSEDNYDINTLGFEDTVREEIMKSVELLEEEKEFTEEIVKGMNIKKTQCPECGHEFPI